MKIPNGFYFAVFNTLLLYHPIYSKMNVLLIIIPDLRSMFGMQNPKMPVAQMPNLDMLSYESIRFTNMYVQQASTVASRVSLLTGRRPDSHGVFDDKTYWRSKANLTTLPQYFRQAGYYTASIGNVLPFGACSGFSGDHPYSWSSYPFSSYTQRFDNNPNCLFINGSQTRYVSNAVCPVIMKHQPCGTLPDMEAAWATKTFLASTSRISKPFFLVVGFYRPQFPLKFPVHNLWHYQFKMIKMPRNKIRGLVPPVAWSPWESLRNYFDIRSLNLRFPYEIMPDNYTRLIRQSYFASLTYIDSLVGEVLRDLITMGLYKNTIIAVVGDRGCMLGESGMWGGDTLYDTATRTTMILRIPHVTSSHAMRFRRVCHDLTEQVDVFPTLVDAAGLTPLLPCLSYLPGAQACSEGSSLIPIIYDYITDPSLIKRSVRQWKQAVFSQIPRGSAHPKAGSATPTADKIKIMGYSVRTPRYKFVEWVKHMGTGQINWSQPVVQELYDFSIDPTESLNLAFRPQLQNIVQKLRFLLHSGWTQVIPVVQFNTSHF